MVNCRLKKNKNKAICRSKMKIFKIWGKALKLDGKVVYTRINGKVPKGFVIKKGAKINGKVVYVKR